MAKLAPRVRMDLSGTWERRIGDGVVEPIPVPSSYHIIGTAVLARKVRLPKAFVAGRQVFLCFEGVLSEGEVSWAGKRAGKVGPWVPYELEVPAKAGEQELAVTLRDYTPEFGPVRGRDFRGGIVRDVYLESRPQVFISHLKSVPRLNETFDQAACELTVEVNAAKPVKAVQVSATLRGHGNAARAESKPKAVVRGITRITLRFSVQRPRLWSPENPRLYALRVRLLISGQVADQQQVETGFRDVRVKGRDIYLNGKRLVLTGICRHEFIEGHGFGVPSAAVKRDLAAIKATGCNYIRLVHMPQSQEVVRWANRLGLLLSEETALCWVKPDDPSQYVGAMEVLRRLIRRDCNAPSVVAWLIYNECHVTPKYVRDAVDLCHREDPLRLVSAANWSLDPKRDASYIGLLKKSAMDLYALNLYTVHGKDFSRHLAPFRDRPVVITEWGAEYVLDSPWRWKRVGYWLARAVNSDPQAPDHLSGTSFWVWRDYEERTRVGDSCRGGYLIGGVLHPDGTPKPDLLHFKRVVAAMKNPGLLVAQQVTVHRPVVSLRKQPHYEPLDLSPLCGSPAQMEVRERLREERKKFSVPRMLEVGPEVLEQPLGNVKVAGVPFQCADQVVPGVPLVLTAAHPKLEIPVGAPASRVHFLGHVCYFNTAFPAGKFGRPIAHYVLRFASGRERTVVLENGKHHCRMNLTYGNWPIDARAWEAPRALTVWLDEQCEMNQVNWFTCTVSSKQRLQSIRWELLDKESVPVLYAVTLER